MKSNYKTISVCAFSCLVFSSLVFSDPATAAPQRSISKSKATDLEEVIFNPSQPLRSRWEAVTSSTQLHGERARPILEKALKSEDWFLRNAALIAAPKLDREWAIQWSRMLLHDRALVVRTAAVQALNELNAIEAESLLWEKLYSSENYRNGESLWVRRHIAELLARFASHSKKDEFIKMLKDKDESLHTSALAALEKISGDKKTRQEWLSL